MALVHDDEVEERRVEGAEYLLAVLAHELLVEAEVHLVGAVQRAALDLRGHLLQGLEVAGDGLVYEDVAVREVEHLAHDAALAEAVDQLERGERLPSARRHDEQDAALAVRDGPNRLVDGVALVVARG